MPKSEDPTYQYDEDYQPSDSQDSVDDVQETVQPSTEIRDAQTIVDQHKNVSIANALAINKRMQEHLATLKTHLEMMLEQCRSKYEANEEQLMKQIETNNHDALKGRSTSFAFFGYPFFKNLNLISARPNADYLYRKNHLKEYFPMDTYDPPIYWVTLDKVFLINGVREQVLQQLLLEFKTAKRSETQIDANSLTVLTNRYHRQLKKKRLLDLMCMLNDAAGIKLDWYTISMKNLDDRHKPHVCEAMWNAFLHPFLNRQPWTSDEDDRLLNEIECCVPVDWSKIAMNMPQRSMYQCLVQYRTKLAASKNVCGKWSPEEDELLLRMVQKFRTGNVIPWSNVVAQIPNRNKKQVYHRYRLTLTPDLFREKFTPEEDGKILDAFVVYGNNFHMYKNVLPNRTTNQIRNRYSNVLKFMGISKDWTPADDAKLMEHVAEFGTSDWSSCSQKMQIHSRTSCRSRYIAIMKNLQKNPNCRLEDIPRRKKLRTAQSRTRITPSDDWTPADDAKLMQCVAEFGINDWAACSKELKNHPRTSCKARYFAIMKHREKNPNCRLEDIPRRKNQRPELVQAAESGITHSDDWTPADDAKLMQHIYESGIHNWSACSEALGNHTRSSCKARYKSIMKHMEKNPNCKLEDVPRRKKNPNSKPEDIPRRKKHRPELPEIAEADGAQSKEHVEQQMEVLTQESPKTYCRTALKNYLEEKSNLAKTKPKTEFVETPVVVEKPVEPSAEVSKQKETKTKSVTNNISDVDRSLDTYLKYSYDYNMQPVREGHHPVTDNTMAVCRVLKSEMCPVDYQLLNALSDASIDVQCMEEPENAQNNQTVPNVPPLPANYNTALIQRGLAIMYPEELNAEERARIRTTVKHPALDLFRQRFRSLLTNAAMASKLNLQTLHMQEAEEDRSTDIYTIRIISDETDEPESVGCKSETYPVESVILPPDTVSTKRKPKLKTSRAKKPKTTK